MQCFRRWIACAQNDDGAIFPAYFSLAQLSHGDEALELWTRGIQLLEAKLMEIGEGGDAAMDADDDSDEDDDERAEWVRQLSQAYCALAELYTTDCW